MRAALGLALLAVVIAGCGEVTALSLEVDLGALRVPDDVDTLHFRLAHDPSFLAERSFAVDAGDLPPSLTVVQGEHTPESLTVTVFADHSGTAVAESAPTPVSFRSGHTIDVRLAVSP